MVKHTLMLEGVNNSSRQKRISTTRIVEYEKLKMFFSDSMVVFPIRAPNIWVRNALWFSLMFSGFSYTFS